MGWDTDADTISPHGNFSYPPPGSRLVFNSVDSLITSWLTFDPDPTDCLLSLWGWQGVDPWKIGYNRTAPPNGTTLVPLNIASNSFWAQLNLNFTASDGSPQRILSWPFIVNDSPQARAVTWSQGVLPAPTPSPSTVPQTSISASLLTSSAPTASSTLSVSNSSSTSSSRLGTGAIASTTSTAPQSSRSVSNPATTNDSRLGAGAIAGIAVAIVVSVGVAASLVFYLRRRKSKKTRAEIELSPSAGFQLSIPATFIGKNDATPLQARELWGNGQPVEMATGYQGEMDVSIDRA